MQHICTAFALLLCPSQVLVGAHAVLANGGVIAPAGVHMVALAAKRHSIPFVVLVGLHKLSPLFPHDPDVTLNGGGRSIKFDQSLTKRQQLNRCRRRGPAQHASGC